ncbi:MAG: hypothetical protein GY754_12860 [bacterium]|nr:hypothetical protein [bacterium]
MKDEKNKEEKIERIEKTPRIRATCLVTLIGISATIGGAGYIIYSLIA